jgi:hypothetical protein
MVSYWALYSAGYRKHGPLPTTKVCSLPESAGANGSYLSLQRIQNGYYYSQIKGIYLTPPTTSETALLNIMFISKQNDALAPRATI